MRRGGRMLYLHFAIAISVVMGGVGVLAEANPPHSVESSLEGAGRGNGNGNGRHAPKAIDPRRKTVWNLWGLFGGEGGEGAKDTRQRPTHQNKGKDGPGK